MTEQAPGNVPEEFQVLDDDLPRWMYDDVLRMPLLVRWPGVLPPGTVCDAFMSHEIDLARTLLAAAGVPAPPSFVGRDLVAAATGTWPADHPPRPDIFAQYQGTHHGLYSQRALRDRRWKYVYNPVSRDELYDLATDPGEIVRAHDPACADVLRRMRERMGEWMSDLKDPLSPPLFSCR